MNSQPALVGIDWGTTHLRAFQIGTKGQILDRRESRSGISAIPDGRFESALSEIAGTWLAARSVPIVMCGMIGSRNGWFEVPYQPCPAGIEHLARSMTRIDSSLGPLWIVSGLSAVSKNCEHDVMRGEETLVAGVLSGSDREFVLCPGTHSKWILAGESTVTAFRTYMTGEIYSLLREHSTLRWTITGDEQDSNVFLDGVLAARRDPDLLHALFKVRTRGLFKPSEAKSMSSYLSGVLIGCEVLRGLAHFDSDAATIVSSEKLAGLYKLALDAHGLGNVRCVDSGSAAARGLWRIWKSMR